MLGRTAAIAAGKLFHLDLGAQKPNRYDHGLRFGAEDIKEAFFLVKLLEDNAWDGPRAFDVKPYRADAAERVWDWSGVAWAATWS